MNIVFGLNGINMIAWCFVINLQRALEGPEAQRKTGWRTH